MPTFEQGAETLRMNATFRLQWEEAQQGYVLLYPEGMVKLNQSASEILKLCDGTRTLEKLVADLEVAFETAGLAAEVATFVEHAKGRGWIIT
ncbi:pyrroloquinoline quinone biosynthesis peptide chaperone PqqD [Pusillimonas sp. ANT_WB101]|uniref:pyrroloquinoline quinone biosynthesis peptide chaperone PqqD n=1 Tax=Pusillimonas sp. ANT_WB101 TaxID=2597356 RepID=UPI0011F030E6|nr:pyrroloquinoline quinone biosynthesis peptide chaperone PqqD [Pusillimonas sp. ANT_WB101]KAA0910797.1 pyrroloquinoline quinone biosynthesis peptide chaperone PqqD [Pusillimonas sp. ANT_WB101]